MNVFFIGKSIKRIYWIYMWFLFSFIMDPSRDTVIQEVSVYGILRRFLKEKLFILPPFPIEVKDHSSTELHHTGLGSTSRTKDTLLQKMAFSRNKHLPVNAISNKNIAWCYSY